MMTRAMTGILLALFGYTLFGLRAACDVPIAYRVGEVDSRFGLSREEVRSALEQAEAVWETSTRRELFRHEDDAELAVHFFYDNRQRIAQENAIRKNAIDKHGRGAQKLKSRYDAVKARYEQVRRTHASRKSAYDARVAAHNRNVDTWNRRGGAPRAEFQAMQFEEAAIASSAAALEASRLRVNSLADRANALSGRYNDLATALNAEIDTVNSTAGREFKQGLFTRNASGVRIDVYEYVSMEDLVHVLAHELGHALGLGHNDNPASIMYGVNSTKMSVPTADDLAALHETCGR